MDVSKLPEPKVTVVSEVAVEKALFPIDVTLAGIAANPAHALLPVTTLSVIVKVPEVPQDSVVTTAARAGLEIKAISKAEIVTKGMMSLRI